MLLLLLQLYKYSSASHLLITIGRSFVRCGQHIDRLSIDFFPQRWNGNFGMLGRLDASSRSSAAPSLEFDLIRRSAVGWRRHLRDTCSRWQSRLRSALGQSSISTYNTDYWPHPRNSMAWGGLSCCSDMTPNSRTARQGGRRGNRPGGRVR